jgi:hypothetical protein
MRLTRITPALVCSLALIVGCAKSEDQPQAAANPPTSQPAASSTGATPIAATPNQANIAPAEPTASMLMINRAAQWFPPARLRLSSDKDGKVVARLYSDDPKDVLTGKETVNSYDIVMVLPDISDPADISKTVWIDRSSSMDKQDTHYGIFLNGQQDVLQPMNVTVGFQGQAPRLNVIVRGTFNLYHISEQTPNPAPTMVSVMGFLDARVMEK